MQDPARHRLWRWKQSCMPVGLQCLTAQPGWPQLKRSNIPVVPSSRNWCVCEFSTARMETGVKVSLIFPLGLPWARKEEELRAGRRRRTANAGFAGAKHTRKEDSVFLKHLGCTLWCWRTKIKKESQRIVLLKWMRGSKEDGRILICSLNNF